MKSGGGARGLATWHSIVTGLTNLFHDLKIGPLSSSSLFLAAEGVGDDLEQIFTESHLSR
jgi:hypothetical protein